MAGWGMSSLFGGLLGGGSSLRGWGLLHNRLEAVGAWLVWGWGWVVWSWVVWGRLVVSWGRVVDWGRLVVNWSWGWLVSWLGGGLVSWLGCWLVWGGLVLWVGSLSLVLDISDVSGRSGLVADDLDTTVR